MTAQPLPRLHPASNPNSQLRVSHGRGELSVLVLSESPRVSHIAATRPERLEAVERIDREG